MPKFVPGLKLSRLFYQRVVSKIMEKEFPNLCYSAAVIGWGSEVLACDTGTSRDHHWGPRLLLFLGEKEYPRLKNKISVSLSKELPYEFMGYSTNYSEPEPNGVRNPVMISSGPVDHMVQIFTIRSFFKARLGHDPYHKVDVKDWLSFPQQRLLEITSGEVYCDPDGELEKVRVKFEFYPRDVWLYMLASQWTRISQEEAFVGRTGHVGDELGSRVVAVRLIRELMKLCFLIERQYAPYSKWFGSAFERLQIAKDLKPIFLSVIAAETWKTRQKRLASASSLIARRHNSLGITKPLSTDISNYYSRPYLVIHADRFAKEIKSAIKDPKVRKLKTDIGSIDQFTDSTNVIEDFAVIKKLRGVYE